MRTINSIGFGTESGGQDGLRLRLSDTGFLTYELTFTDGSSGIFRTAIVPVPEPTGLLSFAAAAGAFIVGRFLFR
jgi:hypothetical protein